MKTLICMFAAIGLLASFMAPRAAAQIPTRFEAELVNAPVTTADALGYDKVNGFWGDLGDADFGEVGNSNGKVLYTTVQGAKCKLLFAGSGLDVIVRKANNGGIVSWKLDEGATTGTIDSWAAAPEQQAPIQIARNLTQTLHTLEITADLPTSGTAIFLDGFDVYTNQSRFRFDDQSPKVIKQPGVWYADGTFNANVECAGGKIAYTLTNGGTLDVTFVGTAIAIHTTPREDTMAFNWSIDSGAFSGFIDPRPIATEGHAPGGLWYRWPYVLKTGLTDTTHTLHIAAAPSGGGTNFIFCFDAFDFISNTYVDNTPRRYEYEQTNHAINNENDLFAFEHTSGGTWGVFDDNGVSGGKLVYTGGGAGYKTKLMFYGTGVDLYAVDYGEHPKIQWRLDGAPTATVTTLNQAGVVRVPVASGLTKTLHTLEIEAFGDPFTNICRLDCVDVYGASNVTRIDSSDFRYIDYQPMANWTFNDTSAGVDTEAVNATAAYSLMTSDSATIKFNGTAVAVRGRASADIFNLAWDIDNGTYTGVADFASPNPTGIGIWYRWPIVLKSDLPAGDHTLKLTAINTPLTGFLSLIDSIEIVGTPQPVLLSTKGWTVYE